MAENRRSILLFCVCAAILPWIYLHSRAWFPHLFWDARVYADAITAFRQHRSPYSLPNELPFIYPPLFSLAGSWLSRIVPPPLGWNLYLLAHMTSVVAIPLLLARFYLRGIGFAEALFLTLVSPLFITEGIFWAGNIASICYCAALLAAIPGLRRNRWGWFYLAVVLSGLTKITFLLLLLLPILAGCGQLLGSAVTAAITVACYFPQKLWMPDLYRQFQEGLSSQILISHNVGGAPFGVTVDLLKRFHVTSITLPIVVQILFTAAVLWILWQLRLRADGRDPRFLALVVLAVLLLNPRMFIYDMTVGLIPAYFLFILNRRLPLAWILWVLSAAGFFLGHGSLGFLFLFVSAFVLGARDLWIAPGAIVKDRGETIRPAVAAEMAAPSAP